MKGGMFPASFPLSEKKGENSMERMKTDTLAREEKEQEEMETRFYDRIRAYGERYSQTGKTAEKGGVPYDDER